MPIGPRDETRPSDAIAQAALMGRIATGVAEDEYVDADKRHAELQGGLSRAESLDADRRKETAKQAEGLIGLSPRFRPNWRRHDD